MSWQSGTHCGEATSQDTLARTHWPGHTGQDTDARILALTLTARCSILVDTILVGNILVGNVLVDNITVDNILVHTILVNIILVDKTLVQTILVDTILVDNILVEQRGSGGHRRIFVMGSLVGIRGSSRGRGSGRGRGRRVPGHEATRVGR